MREVPALAKLQREFMMKGVDVVAVNIFAAAGLDYWREYLGKFGGENLIIAQDKRQKVMRALRVRFAGTTIVIGREGKEIFRSEQDASYAVLKRVLEFGF